MSEPTKDRPSLRWMILLSRFITTFLLLGSYKSMGVFLPHFMDSFSASTAAVGLVAGLSLGFGQVITSPFVGALLKVWDPRRLTMAGGLVAASCYFAASFSSSISQLAVWFALSSCGLNFVSLAIMKPLMDYFPDDFAFANGVSYSGGTIGMMLLPPAMEYLVSVYGWRNALGLLGALQFNYLVAGALLRPLNTTTAQYEPIQSQSGNENKSTSTRNKQSDQESSRDKKANICKTILTFLGEQLDVHVLTEPIFIIYQLVFALVGLIFSVWHVFLIPHGLALGYGDAPSAYLASFGGFGSLIGRLTHGVLIDREILQASTLFIISCLVFAASSLLDPLAISSYAALATLASISGIAMGFIWPLIFVMMRKVTGDRHMSAYSWLFVSTGAGGLVGVSIAGGIRDVAGEFETVFITIGVVTLVMSAIVASTRCVAYIHVMRREN